MPELQEILKLVGEGPVTQVLLIYLVVWATRSITTSINDLRAEISDLKSVVLKK